MISKEFFVKCINTLKQQHEMCRQLDNIFKDSPQGDFIDGYGFSNAEIEQCLADALGLALCNDLGIVSWWLWETNFGEFDADILNANGEVICYLDTPEKLYDFLVFLKD